MVWIDFVAIVILLAAIAAQSRRGFLQSAFDFLAALISLGIAKSTFGRAEPWTPMIAFTVIFVVLLAASYYLYNLTAFTLETYDPVLGGLFGFATACVIIWAIYWTGDITRLNPAAARPDWILDSRLVDSFYDWKWWKSFLYFMRHLGETT